MFKLKLQWPILCAASMPVVETPDLGQNIHVAEEREKKTN